MMKNILTVIFIFCSVCRSDGQIITTIAGTGVTGYNGDNIQATAASLNNPTFLVADATGNVFFSDDDNNRVRRVSPSSIITTLAGSGVCGFTGNVVLATNAKLCSPAGVAVDIYGNVYIADLGKCQIRKVDTAGVMTLVAGNVAGNFSGDNGPATAAGLGNLFGVAIDAIGNIYLTQAGYNCVRKIDTSGIIKTIAGMGPGALGDGGPATAARLDGPMDITVDEAGNLFIVEFIGARVRKVDVSGMISTVVGTGAHNYSGDGGPATLAELNSPRGIAVDKSGNLYIADADNNRVRKVSITGIITTIAGDGMPGFSGDGGPATAAKLRRPIDVALDAAGRIYITDEENNRIRRIESTVSIKEINTESNSIHIYPNPSSGSFTASITSAIEEQVILCISDMTGRKVAEIRTTTNKPIPIRLNTAPGVHVLTATTARNTWSERIVIRQEE